MLPLAEIHEVAGMIEADIGIEVREFSTTLKLRRGVIAHVVLPDIVPGEERQVGITVRIAP